MVYKAREIKDRVAIGDDCFVIEAIGDGRHRLTPSPDSVVEEGTPINKALLQLMEDRVTYLMNMVVYGLTANPIHVPLDSFEGLESPEGIEGVWDPTARRVDC